MVLNLVVAGARGALHPLSMERFGRDPAVGSSVFLTFVTDSMGFFIFLGLATRLSRLARGGRLFFANWPDDACSRAIAALLPAVAEAVGRQAGAASKDHMTLAFLGEVAESDRARAVKLARP
jgi:hypothetical protein